MSVDPELRKLLEPMRERDVSLEGGGFHVDRARVLARMARPAPPERRSWSGRVGLAVAAALVLVVGARLWPRGGTPSREGDGALEVSVSEGSATRVRGATHDEVTPRQTAHLAADGELETAAGSKARVRMADGLAIELQSQTRVALGELQANASRVRLLGGAIRCTVPHRTAPHAFSVVTSDVTVVDLGTVFTVAIEGPQHATRVSVEEGEVLISHGATPTRVRAPGSWSSAPDVEATAPREPAATAPGSSVTSPAPPRARALVRAPAPSGTLAQEAQLLRQGLAAERQGRAPEAMAALHELLAKYPRSPLAIDARAALARVEAGARQ